MSEPPRRALQVAARVADATLAELARVVPGRVSAALPRLPPPRARVRVAAVGKAAATMARVALDRWRGRVERAIVVVPDGADTSDLGDAEVVHAGHPVPDARSLRAGRALLELATGLDVGDVLLVLVSGGASALACAPIDGVDLAAEQALVRALLASGLAIREVNLVRGHLSQLKRGGIARRAFPARTLGIVLSDVLGADDLQTVGGAPTVVLAADLARVRALLGELGAAGEPIANAIEGWAARTPEAGELAGYARRARTVRAAGPELVVEVAVAAARAAGHRPIVLEPMTGDVDFEADRLARTLLGAAPATLAIAHGEPTVRLPARAGAGGRLGRLVLRVARTIAEHADRALVGRSTDGLDGVGGLAGAAADASSWRAMGALGPHGIDAYDDAPAHRASGGALLARPTGLNLLDLVVLATGP